MHGQPVNGFIQAGNYLKRGFQLIQQPGLRLFVIIPLIINIVIFGILINWAQGVFADWLTTMMSWLPDWLGFLSTLFWLVYGWFIVMILVLGFSALANFIGAPFYSYLAEMTEVKLTGEKKDAQIDWVEFLKMIPRTLMREIQKLIYYIPRAILLLIIGLIPGLNILGAIAWFLFSSWMMAIQYVDYPADNNGQSFGKLKTDLGARRLTALVFGALVGFGMMIPLVNLIILPAAVCGATCFWLDSNQRLASNSQSAMSKV